MRLGLQRTGRVLQNRKGLHQYNEQFGTHCCTLCGCLTAGVQEALECGIRTFQLDVIHYHEQTFMKH